MPAPTELKLLRSIKSGKGLRKLIESLQSARRSSKTTSLPRSKLTAKQRIAVLSKTDGHCHICGTPLQIHNFHADHVKSHCMGGEHAENNYLPSCSTCNNYRWHYSSEEIQIILKLGVWAKARIAAADDLGLAIAEEFMAHVMALRRRK